MPCWCGWAPAARGPPRARGAQSHACRVVEGHTAKPGDTRPVSSVVSVAGQAGLPASRWKGTGGAASVDDWPLKSAQSGGLAARPGSEAWGVIMSGALPHNVTMQQFRCTLQRGAERTIRARLIQKEREGLLRADDEITIARNASADRISQARVQVISREGRGASKGAPRRMFCRQIRPGTVLGEPKNTGKLLGTEDDYLHSSHLVGAAQRSVSEKGTRSCDDRA